MSMEFRATTKASGSVGLLTREEKECQGLVPAPIKVEGCDPLRWAEFRLIAEAGLCNGDLDWAIRAAEAAATAGFWGFKIQMLEAHQIASRSARPYGHGITEPETQRDAYRKTMTGPELQELKAACDDMRLVLFASCWDEGNVDLALDLGFPILKIGSGDITHEWLLRYIGRCGVPVILSTGASWRWEIDQAMSWLAEAPQIALAACTLSYPAEAQDAHLNRIGTLKRAFPHSLIGYSDHCREPWIVGEAKKAGAAFVEVHWTVTPGEGGDHDFALHPGNIDQIHKAPAAWNGDHWGSPDLVPADCERAAREGARRSIAANCPVDRGQRWRAWDLAFLRPGTGIEPWRVADVVGRKAVRDYDSGDLLDIMEGC